MLHPSGSQNRPSAALAYLSGVSPAPRFAGARDPRSFLPPRQPPATLSKGARTALRALTAFESELGSGRIEAPRTYTNQFALRAKARFQA